MKHLLALALLLAFAACTKSSDRNCYRASSREEYDLYSKQWAESSDKTVKIGGEVYNCVDNLATSLEKCYQAKSKEEFEKLSSEQMKNPEMAVEVGGRSYECLKAPL